MVALDLADQLYSVDALKRPADVMYLSADSNHIVVKLDWVSKSPIQ
jgi:hypothetical protein